MESILILYTRMLLTRLRVFRHEEGQGLTEYALILALIAVLCIGALTALQGGISGTLGTITASL